MKTTTRLTTLSPLLALVAIGCGGAPDTSGAAAGEQPIGTTSEAFSSYSRHTLREIGYQHSAVDLGADTSKTCFLAGIGGSLYSDVGVPGDFGEMPSAGVYDSGGHQWFAVDATLPGGNDLEASVLCLPTAANRTSAVEWSTGQAAQKLGAVTAKRQCFLTRVQNHDANSPARRSWSSTADSVHIWNDGANWWIGGTGYASATGACVDVSAGEGSWEWIDGTGTRTDNLAYNAAGVQCLLTGLLGSFEKNQFSDGVYVNYDKPLRQWTMTTNNGKGGWASCFK